MIVKKATRNLDRRMPPTPTRSPRAADAPKKFELMELAYETARHYGNMRFTMFTVFTAVVGALMATPFTAGGSQFIYASALHKTLLCVTGTVAGLFFGLSEFRISRLVIFYQEAAFKLGALPIPPGHNTWRVVVSLTMLLPAALTVVFWLLLGFDVIQTPLLKGT